MKLWIALDGAPVYLAVEESDRIVACLPGVEFGAKLVRRFQAMPNGCYARLLIDPDQSDRRNEVVRALLDHLASATYAKLYLTDYRGDFGEDERFGSEQTETLLVDISDPDWEPPDKKMRQQIRKAIREERAVERFQWSRHHADFMRLVHTSSMRIGQQPKYPPAFFEAMAELAKTDDRVRWVWMEDDGRPVASSIFLAESDHLLHWQVYFDDEHGHLQPNKIIPFLMARQWAAEGGRFLNLGTTPGDLKGVSEYKAKWGGEPHCYRTLVRKSGLGRLT